MGSDDMTGFGRQRLYVLISIGVVILLAACSSSAPQPDNLTPTVAADEITMTPTTKVTILPPTLSPTPLPPTRTPTLPTATQVLSPTTVPLSSLDLPGWIAYTAVLNPGTGVRIDLASITPDGHNQTWITDTDTDSLIGVFSASGEQIAYWSFDLQTQISNLWVIDLETESSRPLTTEGTIFMNPITWSPDGNSIA
jgi:hypothetical protein